jgi:hypothetical protein
MQLTNYRIPYSKSSLDLSLPAGMQGTLSVSRPAEPINDVSAARKAPARAWANSVSWLPCVTRPTYILEDARRNGYPPGQQRAFVMARVLEQCKVVIVGSECPDLVAACKMIPAVTIDEALNLATKELGSACRVLVVPHAMLTLPVIQGKAGTQ